MTQTENFSNGILPCGKFFHHLSICCTNMSFSSNLSLTVVIRPLLDTYPRYSHYNELPNTSIASHNTSQQQHTCFLQVFNVIGTSIIYDILENNGISTPTRFVHTVFLNRTKFFASNLICENLICRIQVSTSCGGIPRVSPILPNIGP